MYQRGNILSSLPQVTKVLLVINILVFLVDMVSGRIVANLFALYTYSTGGFRPFQIITHMFVHANFGHLFMNMFGLFLFGRTIEAVLGSKKMFILYFVSGLGAAGLQFLIFYFQGTSTLMVGASGAIMGILGAFALMFPNVELMLIFLPIPIKAKYFVPIFMVLELFLGVANFSFDNIAHFAHLGGAIAGFILAWYWKKNQFSNHMY
jgi:membrane associated rhomboid family serine protease